jgi:asparagine synthase (glutamine-hydrolysing)
MLRCLLHEPFYVSGRLSEPKGAARIYTGWACHSKAAAASLPIWNEQRDVALIVHGEIVGLDEEAALLRKRGHQIQSDGFECIVHSYEEHGIPFLARLNGRFSGLLLDLRERKSILFNDRFGLNRIYWNEKSDAFRFSSCARSLLSVLPECRRFEEQSLAEYFAVGCVLQNRSLFSGLALLPPGSAWTFYADGRSERTRYFDPVQWEQQEILEPAAYTEKLIASFAKVPPRYLLDGEPLAMSLTGGLDSRMVLAWANVKPGQLPCYTFGGPYRECADVRIARELARAAGQSHNTLYVEKDFFEDFPRLATKCVQVSDGAMDVSGAVEVYMNSKARQIAPVRLTGNYGSEILRSNVAFRPGRLDRSLFSTGFAALLDAANDTFQSEACGHRLSFIAFKQVPWHHYARFAVEQSQLRPRSPFLDNDVVALAYQAPPALASSPQPLLDLITAGNPALDRVRTDRALQRGTSSPVGKLSRFWQEFTAKAEYACDYGMPAKLVSVDRLIRWSHWERLFLGCHKFYHFRVWYRDRLAEAVRTLASNFNTSTDCYREEAVHRIIDEHLSGRANRTLDLHKLLAVLLIDRVVLRFP